MFGANVVPAVTRTLLALALATGLAAGASRPAEASIMTDANLMCAEGAAAFGIGLPISGSARMSVFAYRLDGGAWTYTNWYYTSPGRYWIYEGGWVEVDTAYSAYIVGNNHLVDAFEYRYDPSTRAGRWISLGACRTTSFFESGITFH